MEELLREVALWSGHEPDQLAGGESVEKASSATQPATLANPQREHTDGAASQVRTGTALRNFTARTGDESWMREICTSSLTRGRDIARQAWYAVFRHIRGNPETRSTETYPYRCTLSTLPADGTLALDADRGFELRPAKAGITCERR